MQKYLDELVKTGLVQRYVNGGSTFLYFPNFGKHQPGLNKNKEAPSEIPPFTPELVGSNDGVSPAQVKVQVKDKVQVKVEDKDTPLIPPVSCISPNKEELRVTNLETVLSAYRENILCGDTIPEDMEADLKAAVQRFSADWVIDAIKEACRANKSYWYYIAGILKNWQRYGKGANFPSKEAQ
jgi:DnaD/phage-associated family protein